MPTKITEAGCWVRGCSGSCSSVSTKPLRWSKLTPPAALNLGLLHRLGPGPGILVPRLQDMVCLFHVDWNGVRWLLRDQALQDIAYVVGHQGGDGPQHQGFEHAAPRVGLGDVGLQDADDDEAKAG